MKMIFIVCEEFKDIYDYLNRIYISEDIYEILGEDFNNLCVLLNGWYDRDYIANCILRIMFKNVLFNLITVSLDAEKLNIFLKLYNQGMSLNNVVVYDFRLLDELYKPGMNVNNSDIISLMENILARFFKYIDKDINSTEYQWNNIVDIIVTCYNKLYEQLSTEVNITNFRLELFSLTHIYLLVYQFK